MINNKPAPAAVAGPMIVMECPTPHLVDAGIKLNDKYVKLAHKLNFRPPELLQKKLLWFLNQNNIGVFDYDEVQRYMTALANNSEKVWVWRPLREQDIPDFRWNGRSPNFNNYFARNGHGSYCNEGKYRSYQYEVPMRILLEVENISNVSEELKFFVSNYDGRNSSRFIMVTALNVKKFIFDTW